MDIKFIGTGGAFDWEHGNSAAIIHFKHMKILLDCGNSTYYNLRKKKAIDAITHVLITHMHDDHVGSLSSLLLHHKIFNNNKLSLLYAEEHHRETIRAYLSFSLKVPEEYIHYQDLNKTEGISFLSTRGKHVKWMQTYAYFFDDGNKRIAYSGDLGDSEILFTELGKMEMKDTIVFHDMTFNSENKAHAYYKDLQKQLGKYSLYGYHNDPGDNTADNKIPLVHDTPEFML